MAKKFTYKSYESKYATQIDSLLKEREQVNTSYDYNNDPAFVAAKNDFERQQAYATESARARMNATVGGSGSGTATATAMAQVNNDYLKRINDLIPVYKQMALDSLDTQIETLQKLEDSDYAQYSDARDFAYDNYVSTRDYNYQKAQDKKTFNYQKAQDTKNFNYKKTQDAKEFAYKQTTDQRTYALQLANTKKTNSTATSDSFIGNSGGTSTKTVRENMLTYAQYLWKQSSSKAMEYTFNYIRSFGLTRKEELSIINRLPKVRNKSALYWYQKYGYDTRS